MRYNEISTPSELMQFLDAEFQYGVIDKQGNRLLDSNSTEFQNACNHDWTLRTVSKMLKEKIGHCYDQVELERDWFESHGYKVKTFWVCAFEHGKSGYAHAYLVFQDKEGWKYFEHANAGCKGIFSFPTLDEAVRYQADKQREYANFQCKADYYEVCIKEFTMPSAGLTMQEYLDFIDKSKDYYLD